MNKEKITYKSELQTYLLNEVHKRFPIKGDGIEFLQNLFGISRDAVYRRFRAETILSPDEVTTLARAFNVSLDRFVYGQTDAVMFNFNHFSKPTRSFKEYLDSLGADLAQLKLLPECHVWYASAEIPLFYYMLFPELLEFKLYVWGRVVWDFEYLKKQKFHFGVVNEPIMRLSEELYQQYRYQASTELWTLNIFDNTLNQVEYHLMSGLFETPTSAILLCEKMLKLVTHMQKMAFSQSKLTLKSEIDTEKMTEEEIQQFNNNIGTFKLYHNEMIYTNNTIMVKSKLGRAVYTTFGNPNFLKTTEPRICDYTEDWFNGIVKNSVPLWGEDEKAREWYFSRLKRRIEIAQNRMQDFIDRI